MQKVPGDSGKKEKRREAANATNPRRIVRMAFISWWDVRCPKGNAGNCRTALKVVTVSRKGSVRGLLASAVKESRTTSQVRRIFTARKLRGKKVLKRFQTEPGRPMWSGQT